MIFRPPRIFHFLSCFHYVFMFFQNRSWRPSLEGPGADLVSSGWLWCHFRFWGDPKDGPWNHFSDQDVAKRRRPSLRLVTIRGHNHIRNGVHVRINKNTPWAWPRHDSLLFFAPIYTRQIAFVTIFDFEGIQIMGLDDKPQAPIIVKLIHMATS